MAAPTKKLINSVETCVDDSIDGYVGRNPGVARVGRTKIVVRTDLQQYKAQGKVCVLSGGGSGHEPLIMGYVGPGMLTGAVHGAVFAAPGSKAVFTALSVLGTDHPAGVLVLFNNYTGDRLNFGIGIQRAQAAGIKVAVSILGEDCAGYGNTQTGRRGLTGCVIMYKVAGALAEKGKSLPEILEFVQKVANNMGTMGVCLAPCSVPGGPPMFDLGPENMEFGLGLHGEAGVLRVKMVSAKEAVSNIIDHMTDEKNPACIKVKSGDQVAILLNNLGATSDLEMNIVMKEVLEYLDKKGVQVMRAFSGRFGTSLEMAGLSVTVLILHDNFLQCLDAECGVPSWMPPIPVSCDVTKPNFDKVLDASAVEAQGNFCTASEEQQQKLKLALQAVCTAMPQAESVLNQLDSSAGDGDCGTTLKSGAQAILVELEQGSLCLSRPGLLLSQLSALSEAHMGGTSGALYSLYLMAASRELAADCSPQGWLKAMAAGLDTVKQYGQAQLGDRTMVDALEPAIDTLKEKLDSERPLVALTAASQAAQESAEATAQMKAGAGRATYVNPDLLTQPDPGAMAVALIIQSVCQVLQDTE